MLERIARQAHLHERADDVGGFRFGQHDHVACVWPVHDLADGRELVQMRKRQANHQKTRVGIGFNGVKHAVVRLDDGDASDALERPQQVRNARTHQRMGFDQNSVHRCSRPVTDLANILVAPSEKQAGADPRSESF